jgi:REP element-mobilizing transposase RayT
MCAEVNGWRIDEISIQKDHVHIIVQFVSTISISKMVQLKTGNPLV